MSDIVLFIDDAQRQSAMASALQEAGCTVGVAASGDGEDWIAAQSPAVAVFDCAHARLCALVSASGQSIETVLLCAAPADAAAARVVLPEGTEPGVVVVLLRYIVRASAAARSLHRSYEDLRQLSWAVGHDLAEPLRSIVSYNQLLERRYKGKLDAEADEFITHTVTAAHRMRAFMTDLLTYTQALSDVTPSIGPISMEAIFWAVNMTLHDAAKAEGAKLTHDTLPTVRGNETRLTQLLQALISNALKFVGDKPPNVHVSARRVDNVWEFCVSDNGPGIDPRYYARVFEPFRRLHGREIPGSGLGLALARVVVESHHGRIWVDSEPGAGSKFFFTFPAVDQQ